MIRSLLVQAIDDIDAGNCNASTEQQENLLHTLANISNPDQFMCKIDACDYLGVSRATFDRYVHDGFIPRGFKIGNSKELFWNKISLDIYIDKYKKQAC